MRAQRGAAQRETAVKQIRMRYIESLLIYRKYLVLALNVFQIRNTLYPGPPQGVAIGGWTSLASVPSN